MSRWPWLTMVLVTILVVTPLAREVFYAAFISSERWMQDFWRLVYLAGVAIAILVGFIEWGVRAIIARRRARASALQAASGEHKTES
jgi:ABC-type sugar transport system permease subunit